jgi:hypothetical protein
MNNNLIASCGMNCGICLGYLREKNRCFGCRSIDKSSCCKKCIIKNCLILKKNKMKFCSDKCYKYPCLRLKNLDKRYKNKYGMSMIENLENIKKIGIRDFVKSEKDKWKCKKCGSVICVHRSFCLKCGEKLK